MAGTLIIYVFGLFFLGVQTRGADVAKRLIPVTKCYGELGCLSTGGAFYDLSSRPLQLLPQERNDIDTVFLVYNRNTGGRMELLNPRLPAGISLTRFDPSLETKVIIHGFLDSSRAMWVNQTANEFLRKSDVNVILVDWEKGGAFPYHQATANTRLVGLELAQLITVLGNATGVQPDSFHLIGSGLGAHLASYTGNTLYGRLKRITGLDPAGPYFEGTDIAVRLDPSDAQFVDVIHTDADSLLGAVTGNGGMGMNQPCGHVDFYPNGGQEQPGCDNSIIDNIIVHGLFESGKQYVACSHIRAHDLFMDSINTQCPYTSYRCDSYENFKTGKCFSCLSDSCSSMGMKAGETKRPGTGVKYFLETAGSAPFCGTEFTVHFRNEQ
ncbi:pancreatic lipase-related protein 2-like [Lineus longissimus]|uniref:pancreatic lipase-related protein 2-like n=1 Tax=Lineus longissimus TaxID=88925 RepID=UPI00315DC256